MKKSQRDTFTPTEEFEDLTLFANESFDTQDVDLFEFTSEESSPLTRLKSIILSLDWEINDEILQELADEIQHLQPTWQGDKVAEVYLQGLAKIGNYIRTLGAYAHPNSIKLLLTFFYNFEKIISSPDITGDQITQLLKGDVRKFKILQYQINQSEQQTGGEEISIEESFTPTPVQGSPEIQLPDDAQPAQLLKAALLGLDWEVTDESLYQFNANLSTCRDQMAENKAALVLLQGLQALGDYIAEERANSHPDAFTLLHSFNDALEQVTAEPSKDEDEIQELLVDRINRLNNLKMVIASPKSDVAATEEIIAGVVEEISTPATITAAQDIDEKTEEIAAPTLDFEEELTQEGTSEEEQEAFSLGAEIDSIFGMESKPAMETADEQYPDEILPPDAIHPVDDELADDLIGAQLSSKRGLAPALSDAEEFAGFNAEDTDEDFSTQNNLSEQLDFLFADTDDTQPAEDQEDERVVLVTGEAEPIAALTDIEFSLEEGAEPKAAVEPPGDEIEQSMLDIESKLDSFFLDETEEQPAPEVSEAMVEETENSIFFAETDSPETALADSEEQSGFSEEAAIASLDHSPIGEIEEKLDFFFGQELDEQVAPVAAVTEETDENAVPASDLVGFEEAFDTKPTPAAVTMEEESNELSGALDAFFDTSDASPEPLTEQVAETDILTEAIAASLDEAKPASPETFQVELSSLGAILPSAVRVLDRDKLQEANSRLETLLEQSPSNEHKALGQLLQSVVTMLSRLPAKNETNTEKLVNYLYEQLLLAQLEPTVLATAIGRFNRWMQEAGTLMPLVPAAGGDDEENGPQFHYTAKELYFELAQLRLYMNDEFAKIRHHLKHHH